MFAEIESYIHRLRQKVSRSEWAIRHLGLTPSEGTAEEPGLLMIQIDGLARTQLERAVRSGRMPFLQRLLKRDGYELHNFYPGIPTTTPAVQAELYYGLKSAVPAFSFLNRTKKELGMMYQSEWAKAFEASYQEKATGLLKGGSSWSNIYTGGASPEESHFCAASIGFGDMWRTGKIRNIFLFILFQFPAAVRIAVLLVREIFVALMDVIDGVRQGEKLWLELAMAFSRVFIGTGLRELVTIGGKVDLARGLPIIHINFLSYDEHAHRRGPGSKFAHWSLRDIDRAIKDLFRGAQRSRRRDYSVWVFSDHGQEKARSFALEFPGGVEKIIRDCLEISQKSDPAWQPRSQRRPQPDWFSRGARVQRRMQRSAATNTLTTSEKMTFTVAALGPVGHVYFAEPLDFERRLSLARRIVSEGKVPGAIVFERGGRKVWIYPTGESDISSEIATSFPHTPAVRAQIAEDLAGFCENENAGDLILLGWSPGTEPWTFAPERGAHAGLGLEETRGFVLTPARTRLPANADQFIRPSGLRAAALHHLGREALPKIEVTEQAPRFRLVTYNTHGCSGTDGRVSPRRIARILAAHQPDIIALQELDLGRRRSRAEDQASIIAQELGFHAVFCPTVTHGGEHYGHALLSRWPVQTIKRSLLPGVRGGWIREPRAAIWVKVKIGETYVNVVTTHLGLGREERRLQVEALIGHEWLGAMDPDEPLLICGDFNMMPGSGPYGRLSSRLRDVQVAHNGHRPLRTFTSIRPFTRIDHVFVSPLLTAQHIFVPRTHLTRVASDHLPLIVDLQLASASVEKPTHILASP